MTPDEIDAFIRSHVWTFARTMPNAPHEYVVKARCRDPIEFEAFARHIREHGYRGNFGGRRYVYFDWPVDGVMHQFWTMGAPLADTVIINRCVKR